MPIRALLFSLLLAVSSLSAATPFGNDTRGGLDGRVIKVTTLENSGEGSLREALAASGPRVIVFEVGGIIDLERKDLIIREPFVTIAGQTAPSPGITLIRGGIKVRTNDVVMQHLRVRMGDAGLPKKSGYEVDVSIESNKAYRVIVDHCSVSWATDENLSVSGPLNKGPAGTAHQVTLSNNIIAESLHDSAHGKGPHSMGSLIHDNVQEVAIVGNLYAHNNDRNPWYKGNTSGVIVNNFIYNSGRWAIRLGYVPQEWEGVEPPAPTRVSIVGNVLQAGSNTPKDTPLISVAKGQKGGQAFMADNLAWQQDGSPAPIFTPDISVLAEKPLWPAGLLALPANQTKESVLARAGARPKERDAIDLRLVADIRAGKGRRINSQDEVGGYPTATPSRRTLKIPASGLENWLKKLAADLE